MEITSVKIWGQKAIFEGHAIASTPLCGHSSLLDT